MSTPTTPEPTGPARIAAAFDARHGTGQDPTPTQQPTGVQRLAAALDNNTTDTQENR